MKTIYILLLFFSFSFPLLSQFENDWDGDGSYEFSDCDDNNATVYPGAPEICDNLDNNCDGNVDEGLPLTTYYLDEDLDGFGNYFYGFYCITYDNYAVTNNDDCNDYNPAINPLATDVPNNTIDEDCSGSDETAVLDNDGDGFDNSIDCDDNNAAIHPSAVETCDGIDNNCDGNIDEGLTMTLYYPDNDGDGFGSAIGFSYCNVPTGSFVTNNTDCDDTKSTIYPGATEICDDIDNNCDGNIDEGLFRYWYFDWDEDGYGNVNDTGVWDCYAPYPYYEHVDNNLDCDDNNWLVNPNALEIPNNGIDEDCNGSDFIIDNDGDGSDSNIDCDDNNSIIYPGASEICDGIDNNCDGNIDDGLTMTTYYADVDNDGYGTSNGSDFCNNPGLGFVFDNTDCDDNNSSAYPSASEICDGIDNNCDGNIDEGLTMTTYYADVDNDGYGTSNGSDFCNNPGFGYSVNNDDCDDTNGAINPAETDIPNNSIDEDCNGSDETAILDNDSDGFDNTVDCNDNNATINPGIGEVCDGIDNNCDGNIDEGLIMTTYYADVDNDNFGTGTGADYCLNPGIGFSIDNSDCDDNNPSIYPGATEIADNGTDEDCDGSDYITIFDNDGDGYLSNIDCDDNNSSVYPGAPEICDNIDNNCDGNDDEGLIFNTYYWDIDLDGFGDPFTVAIEVSCNNPGLYFTLDYSDCDDLDSLKYPGAIEICDGKDNNCDGNIDEGLTMTTYYADLDNDNFGAGIGTEFCSNPGTGYSINNTDCNDNNSAINPLATEICDGIDNNCDGNIDEGLSLTTYFVDSDNDNFGAGIGTDFCSNPGTGYSINNTDCNNNNSAINPLATEICDGIDNNCDGNIDEGLSLTTYFVDSDNDNFGAGIGTDYCSNPGTGYSINYTDCNDNNSAINPLAAEICDGIDNNCDGNIDEGLSLTTYFVDSDNDNFGAGIGTEFCSNPGTGYSINNTDCNDNNSAINPDAGEIPNNGIDEDCDGLDLLSGFCDNSIEVLKIYPNPGNDMINFSFHEIINEASIKLVSSVGKVLQIQTIKNTNNLVIQTNDWSSGVYNIEIIIEGKTQTYSWIKR
ncbi:MAG: T9SS type A sorting domain-containing protein [Flavobacteriia bacterium]|nr:T9SS type A sorting domain-containing protein [Flavobacteriia bacterium]